MLHKALVCLALSLGGLMRGLRGDGGIEVQALVVVTAGSVCEVVQNLARTRRQHVITCDRTRLEKGSKQGTGIDVHTCALDTRPLFEARHTRPLYEPITAHTHLGIICLAQLQAVVKAVELGGDGRLDELVHER